MRNFPFITGTCEEILSALVLKCIILRLRFGLDVGIKDSNANKYQSRKFMLRLNYEGINFLYTRDIKCPLCLNEVKTKNTKKNTKKQNDPVNNERKVFPYSFITVIFQNTTQRTLNL